MKWCIWYDDGTRLTSETSDVIVVPCDGVIVIAQEDVEVGRELLHMKDFYYWDVERQRWYGCDSYGLFDYFRRPGWKKIVAGRNTSHQNYHKLMDQARLDPWLPAKNARLTGELPEI